MNYRNSPKIGLSILLISLISMALTLGIGTRLQEGLTTQIGEN